MEDEVQDANLEEESSPVQDEETSESSTEETQVEEATSEQATEKEVPFHEHPRWQELQEEKKQLAEAQAKARAEAEYYRGLAEASKPQDAPKEAVPEGATPEEREFWNKVKGVSQSVAEQIRAEEKKAYEKELQAVRDEYGKIAANQFLKDHPDVQRGSRELSEIVETAKSIGGNLDHAYKIVMFEKAQQTAAEKVRQKTQQKTRDKLAANVETKSIPQNSIPAQQSNTSDITMDDLTKTAKELGITL